MMATARQVHHMIASRHSHVMPADACSGEQCRFTKARKTVCNSYYEAKWKTQ